MSNEEKQQFLKAKNRIRKIWLFYVHFAAYIVLVALLIYNLYIVAGPYKNNIISLNLSILIGWTVFVIVHGLNVFKGKQIFKKDWEDRKTKRFLKEEDEVETKLWE